MPTRSSGISIPITVNPAEAKAALNEVATATEKFAVKVQALSDKAIAANVRQIDTLKALSEQYGVAAASAEKGSTEQVAALKLQADATAKLERVTASYRAESQGMGAAMASVGKNADAALSKLSSLGTALSTRVTLPVLAVGAASVKMASDFTSSMQQIHGLVGVSQKQVDVWSKQLLELGPKVGKSPKELADALYFITSSGISGSKALNVLTVSAKASAAGLGETQTIADLLTSALNAYAGSGLTATKAADQLTAAVKAGKIEASQIAPVLGNVIPQASRLGVSFDQVAAAAEAMSMTGTDAETAVTNLSAFLSAMTKVTPQAAKALASVGLSADGLRQELRDKGLLAVLNTLNEAFHGNLDEIAKVLPNIRALRTELGLTGPQAAQVAKVFHDSANASGDMEQAFASATGSMKFKLDQASASAKAAAINLGMTLAPVVNTLANYVRSLTDWFSKLSPETKKWIAIMAGIAAVVGPTLSLVSAVGRLGAIATQVGGAVVTLGRTFAIQMGLMEGETIALSATIKGALISTGIGALMVAFGVAATYVITHWSKVKGWFEAFWKYLKGSSMAAWDAIKGALDTVIYLTLKDFTLVISEILKVGSHIPFIGGKFKAAANAIDAFVEQWRVKGQKNFASIGQDWGNALGSGFSKSAKVSLNPGGVFAAAGGSFPGSGLSTLTGTAGSMSAGKSKMLALAKEAIGTPYLWGGAGPGGFDCSGLVMWAFSNGLNVKLPHSTYAQAQMGTQVAPPMARVGNVVFTNYGEGGKSGPGHEGVIVGFKNGQPIIEAAPHTGANVRTYLGYQAFSGGAAFTVRDLLAKATPTPTRPATRTTGTGSTSAGTVAAAPPPPLPSATIPTAWKNALTKFNAHVTQSQLDALRASEQSAIKAISAEKASSKGAAIDKVKAQYQAAAKKLEAQLVKNAQAQIKAFEAPLNARIAKDENAVKAYSTMQGVMTGAAATQFGSMILGSLNDEQSALQKEAAKLQAWVNSSKGKVKQAYQSALEQVQSKLSSVSESIGSQLQSLEQAALQTVQTLFGQIQSAADQAFEAQTQAHISALGVQFYQSGLLTPAEQALQQMQYQDTWAQLNQNLQDALKSGDAQQIQQAQRAIAEQKLQEQATQERADADKAYAEAVQKYTDERTRQENALNAALQRMMDAVQNGTGNFSGLNALLAQYGVSQSAVNNILNAGAGTTSNWFAQLNSAAGTLKNAFDALVKWVEGQTHTTVPTAPAPPPPPSGGGGSSPPPPTGGGCFVADTLVATPHGDRRIVEIEPGDEVFCWDFALGGLVSTKVEKVARHEGDDERDVLIVSAAARTLVGTGEHLVWTGDAWEALADTAALWLPGGGSVPLSSRVAGDRQAVYNLHVEHPDHNYVANGFLVHNVKMKLMAAGGIVQRPTFALVGEAGPEAVIPLSQLSMFSRQVIEVPVYLDSKEIARVVTDPVRRELLRTKARNGSTGL